MVKLKDLLNEWTDTSHIGKPKRWTKPSPIEKDGLTEFERNGGVDKQKITEARTAEIESNVSFKILGFGNNDIIISGRKMEITLSFRGNDLKNAVAGKTKKGKVVLAGVKLK